MPLRILPIRTRRGIRIINQTLRAQLPAPIIPDQIPRAIIKPRIPLDKRHSVQPGQRTLQESLVLLLAAPGGIDPELRHPDRLARHVVGELHVVLQVAEGVDVAVPVDGHEVDGAVRAVAQELAEPLQAAGGSTVGDGGGAEAGAAGERFHEGAPGGDGLGDGHAGRAGVAEVGLVEAEEAVGAFVDGFLRVGGPDVREAGVVVEEERDEGEGGVEVGGVGRGVVLVEVVVAPGDERVLAGERVGLGEGVVGVAEASFAGVADGCRRWRGRSRG